MLPAGVLPVGPPVPGSFAVPPSVATSLIFWPKSTGPVVACVDSVGCTGATTKHSLALWSLDPGTPTDESPLKSARKQYRPAAVTVAVGEYTVPAAEMLVEPRSTPPVSQVAVLVAAV